LKYFIKHGVGALSQPLTLALALIALALIFRLRRYPRVARALTVVAVLLVYFACCPIVCDALLYPLESQYPPLREDVAIPSVAYVAVLGSGYAPRDHVTTTTALDGDGLVRIIDGIRLARRIGNVRLIVSGGAPEQQWPSALGYARLARELGVPADSLLVSAEPLDTAAEARAIVRLIGSARFVLVTSASHMPRAMQLMRRAGGQPIAAPVGQRIVPRPLWARLIPTSGGLGNTERAIHEYLGLAALAAGIE
jgi:uncharacterized SAM-binding protein YcdF (DUF218 family)